MPNRAPVPSAPLVGLPSIAVAHPNYWYGVGNGPTDAQLHAEGYTIQAPAAGAVTHSSGFTATASGTVMITYSFSVWGRGIGPGWTVDDNDDIWVSQPVVTQLGCA